jgi:hypothetical protein
LRTRRTTTGIEGSGFVGAYCNTPLRDVGPEIFCSPNRIRLTAAAAFVGNG